MVGAFNRKEYFLQFTDRDSYSLQKDSIDCLTKYIGSVQDMKETEQS